MTTVGRFLRGARATVFAAVCVGLSAAGHVWMSGDAVPVRALVLAFALLAASGYVLFGRQRGFPSIAALMLVGELGLHFLFTATATATATATQGQVAAGAGADALVPAPSAFLSGRVVPASDWICGMAKSGMAAAGPGSLSARLAADLMTRHGTVGMVAVHVVAGLLCAWWLRRGETAVFRLLRTLAVLAATPALLLFLPATLVVPDFLRTSAEPGHDHVPGRCNRLLSTVVARRGPPRSRLLAV